MLESINVWSGLPWIYYTSLHAYANLSILTWESAGIE